ncbi:MAG: hypothetical protein PHV82_15525 [Victivallaceae bacterium]|nr:hypothetical protein [Victivallaceae bacterium]
MKRSRKTERLESVLRDNFNAAPEITVSPNWQQGLLERLHQLKPFQIQAKFERTVWRFSWISFTVSATAAVILALYIYTQAGNNADVDPDGNIYTSLAMLD